MPWLLLPYATTTQALSATTAQVIHGSAPYLTFDNGVTKVTTTEALLSITISDGTTQTTYTPDNTSTAANPIVLRVANQRFTDIGMLVPTNTDSITLNALIGAPYNYWGDDDGDGQGTNGVTASGDLTVSITDKDNQAVSRNAVLSICGAPYKVALTSTAGSLTTQYGLPNSSSFSGGTATYYISPKAVPTICYARPNLTYGTGQYAGPATIWNPDKGFLIQSIDPSGYNRNFPTTGANNLYFDLDIGGVNGSTLTWPTVSQGGITATMTPSPDNANNIRVTLTGPVATAAQQNSNYPGSIARPALPQTFVLVGKDSSNNEVLSYGFELKRWFVPRGTKEDTPANHSSWCSRLGGGYRLSKVKDLTNAVYTTSVNYYNRSIGAGLLAEWGDMGTYTAAGFVGRLCWTSDRDGSRQFFVNTVYGNVRRDYPEFRTNGFCAYP
ncbi:hypothetical protein A9G13_02390 [Gilliamella sp. wkB178]|uniref:hypothetical protein n=1 Tax=Gilliamella sp. wkB178 TaxID=3120259 RepID=UPI00080DF5D8|nr:hypothetical protein [Gilliamella apicola]OCG08929.1 hypothetical protein A9G13_02390 [Gilliamella apicola]